MQSQNKIIFDKIITTAFERQASDIHFTVGSPPILRVDNKLISFLEGVVVTTELIGQVIAFLLDKAEQEALARKKELVLGYNFKPDMRSRVSIFYQKGKPSLSFRLIPQTIKTLDELGLPGAARELAQLDRGFLIVSGPFGSGKSTTIASIIETINKSQSKHIITLEKPIEYIFTNKKSIIEQQEVGRDLPALVQGLEFVEGEDVDIIVSSEMDEPLVIEKLLALAESGRQVVSQITVDSVHKTLKRIDSFFLKEKRELIRLMLGDNLSGIISQRLLSRLGGGRILVAEVLVSTPAVRSIIKEGRYQQLETIIQTSQSEGMLALDRSLAELVQTGEILLEDALEQANDPSNLKAMVR